MKAAFDLHVRRPELPAPLRRWVHEYYETGLDVPRGETARIPISATTDPVLNVMLSGSLVIRIEDGFLLPPVTIGGPQPAAYEVEASGALRGFYVRFTTVGPLALLGVDDYSLVGGGAPPLHEMVRPELTPVAAGRRAGHLRRARRPGGRPGASAAHLAALPRRPDHEAVPRPAGRQRPARSSEGIGRHRRGRPGERRAGRVHRLPRRGARIPEEGQPGPGLPRDPGVPGPEPEMNGALCPAREETR